MNILIVAATWNEIKPLENYLLQAEDEGKLQNHSVEITVTGVGGVATAFQLGKILAAGNCDLAIQLGICGSFRKELPIGTTVNVIEEIMSDLGAEDDENFIDAFEIGLIDKNKFPFSHGTLKNTSAPSFMVLKQLPEVKGITVNKVHGNEKSIERVISKYNPDVESMEGAAFFYSCKMASIPFTEIRTVSNMVEKRNRSKWNPELAINNLNKAAIRLIEQCLTPN